MIRSFDSEATYRDAIAATIALAQRELCIFDADLLAMGLEDAGRIALLTNFVTADRGRRIRCIIHDPDPMQRFAPRWLDFLRRYGHAVEIRRTPERLRHLSDRWVLADGQHATIRFHVDHARGKQVTSDAAEIQSWWQRAEELWAEAEPCSPADVTGL